MISASAFRNSIRPPQAQGWKSRSARRSHPTRRAICSGSSPTMLRRWRVGSAISSSPCARSHFISILYSRPRSLNEGWASYWHARLLREADFVPQQAYVDAIKCHSDVVRPVAADQQVALHINPYHLGFAMWEKIVERDGMDAARHIMEQDDDFGFIRNHLTRDLADEAAACFASALRATTAK